MSDPDKAADDIIALMHGAPGPYMETETSFWGKKRVDSSMKDAGMETDCGGLMITKTAMTYGEADALAASVDLTGFPAFLKALTSNCYWKSSYEEQRDQRFRGEVWWAIYSFLATEGHIEGDPKSYKNQMEYLYDEVLKRLVADGVFVDVAGGMWFTYE